MGAYSDLDSVAQSVVRLALIRLTPEDRAHIDEVAAKHGLSRLDVVAMAATETDPRGVAS